MSTSPSSSGQAARAELAARLREIRLEHELTGTELAGRAGWHRTKVSQIEHATRPPSRNDILTWCRVCDAADEAEDLIARLRDVEGGYVEWKRLERTGLRRLQESALVEFDECRHLRAYCSRIVPGLLQTAEYTRALLRSIQRFRDLPDDVEAAVAVRMERQRVLTRGDHRFAFLIEESVLRYRLGDAECMTGQLGNLLTVMSLPSVALGIIPFARTRTTVPRPDFTMFDAENVQVELPSALITVTVPGEIAIYAKAFEEQAWPVAWRSMDALSQTTRTALIPGSPHLDKRGAPQEDMMTITLESEQIRRGAPVMLWLDLTRRCQLGCAHCFNASGPAGDHGTMARGDWVRVLDQAAAWGVRRVQYIGGEPTMHPDALSLTEHALDLGLSVEVFTNLVHVSPRWWDLFQRAGVSVATSYYSADPAEHNAVTRRPSHARTRSNIIRAVRLGVPLRAGVIDTGDRDRAERACRDLNAIGVARIRVDRVRAFGRADADQTPTTAELCGRCGEGRAAIGPQGEVSPCVMSGWMSVGNVHEEPLAAIVGGTAMAEATAAIRAVPRAGACDPDQECTPGHPGSECNPRT